MSEENKAPETASSPEQVKPEETKAAESSAKPTEQSAVEKPAEKPAATEKPAASAEKPVAAAKPAAAAAAKPAAEKEEPPAPPDPRIVAAQERLDMIKAKIVGKFGESVIEVAEVKKFTPTFVIENLNWPSVVEFVKTEPTLAFTYPECMAGTDYKDYIEVYTLIHSFELNFDLALKVRTPREGAKVPSIVHLFNGLNWEEREIYDLLGVHFERHPDLRRIMLVDEWQGHPLRKDYVVKD